MRAVVVLLVILGIVFAAVMLLGGGGGSDPMREQRIKDGEEEPPAWTTIFDAPFGFLAPRVEAFAAGGASVVRVRAGEEASRRLPSDPDAESRIAAFALEGQGVRIVYACEPGAKGPCRNPDPVTLCLGRPSTPKHDDCQKPKLKTEGALEVGSGGGRVTFINDGDGDVTVILKD